MCDDRDWPHDLTDFWTVLAFVQSRRLTSGLCSRSFSHAVMGQAASTEQQLTEDLQRVDSWHRELSAKVVDTHLDSTFVSSEWGLDRRDLQTHYTIETTDRHGNSWKVDTHYSVVVELLAQLQWDRGLARPRCRPSMSVCPYWGEWWRKPVSMTPAHGCVTGVSERTSCPSDGRPWMPSWRP